MKRAFFAGLKLLTVLLIISQNSPLLSQSKIYWVNQRDDKIQSSNTDGSDIQTIESYGLNRAYGIAVDSKNQKVYWTDFGNDRIKRSDLDGSNTETIISSNLDIPRGIDVDPDGGKIYFVDNHSIKRANLDGSSVETLINGTKMLLGIAVDTKNNKIYYTESEDFGGSIKRANTDGSNVTVITNAWEPAGIDVAPDDGYIFWINDGYITGGYWVPSPNIMRASLSGDNVREILNASDHNPFLANDVAVDEENDQIYWVEGVSYGWESGYEKVCRSSYSGSSVEILIDDLSGDPLLTSLDLYLPGAGINANFNADPKDGYVPLTVNFTDLSTGDITSWLWDFGDGATSTERNPSHTYETIGTYTVELTVSDGEDTDTETKSDFIEVVEYRPIANFIGLPVSGTTPLSVSFTQLSTGPVETYLWDFGDGETSTEEHPVHTFINPGSYTVSLTVHGMDMEDTKTRENYITVNDPPLGYVDIQADILALHAGSTRWGDYDNDGDLDLLITGSDQNSEFQTELYENQTGNFVNVDAGLPPVGYGNTSWGDYDNDGDLDILLSGWDGNENMIRVYENNGGTFSRVEFDIDPVGYLETAWADADNDGDLDILVSGSWGEYKTELYVNNGNRSFTIRDLELPVNLHDGSLTWGDYDNDGDNDFLLTGRNDTDVMTVLYKNNGSYNFSLVTDQLDGVYFWSAAQFGDYDNDGDLDIILTGQSDIDNGNLRETTLYRNDGNDLFTEVESELKDSKQGSVMWGDYDNDGDLDILLSGFDGYSDHIKIYRNDGNDLFVLQDDAFPDAAGSCVWGDYDGDGDLDLAIQGWDGAAGNYFGKIYQNTPYLQNTTPTPPINLQSSYSEGAIVLSWDAGSDTETPTAGLSYNLRVGLTPDGDEILSSHTNPDRTRQLSGMGNVQMNKQWTLSGIPEETELYWAVQTIDGGYAGSAWAKGSVYSSVDYKDHGSGLQTEVFPNPFNDQLTITYQLTIGLPVKITLHDLQGQEIAVIQDSNQPAGTHLIQWSSAQLPAGVYLFRIIAGKNLQQGKIVRE